MVRVMARQLVYAGCNKSVQETDVRSVPIKEKQATRQNSTLLNLLQSMLDKARRQETKKQAMKAVILV